MAFSLVTYVSLALSLEICFCLFWDKEEGYDDLLVEDGFVI